MPNCASTVMTFTQYQKILAYYMKVLLFVGLLVLVVVVFFMNVQEGFTSEEVKADLAIFHEAYSHAITKGSTIKLSSLRFPGGSQAGIRMRAASTDKYKGDADEKKNMNVGMTKPEILTVFDYRIAHPDL